MSKYIRIMILTLVALLPLTSAANYTVDSVEGKVTVNRDHTDIPATPGMELSANDKLNIAPGAKIIIYNALTKELYSSVSAGKTDVTSLMFKARTQASSNNILGKASVTPRSAGNTRQYTQGSVKRALSAYDPEGAAVNADPAQIALQITQVLTGASLPTPVPLEIKADSVGENGRTFTVTNTLPYPIYFNALKVSRSKAGAVELSQLGQPTGCYVLLPEQTITRTHAEDIEPAELHFLVITHYQFDVDEVLSSMAAIRNKSLRVSPMDDSLEVYIVSVK